KAHVGMASPGASELIVDTHWVGILGRVDGSELCLTLGSALGGLGTSELTVDIRSLSTLEAGFEQGRLERVAVSLCSPVSLEDHFFRIWITRLFRTLVMFSCVNSGTSNGGWELGHGLAMEETAENPGSHLQGL
uniref:Uncharacterized protein n=1 Tax=Sciurus vulgaris TaxID=55149 RepID=A0A8D2DRB3_SCIVU